MQLQNSSRTFNTASWLRRFGLTGFLFFFAKGMLWLSLPLLARLFVAS